MYQAFDLGNGREAIRSTPDRTRHIVRHEDDMWTVEEDERREIFLTRGSALNLAREIAWRSRPITANANLEVAATRQSLQGTCRQT